MRRIQSLEGSKRAPSDPQGCGTMPGDSSLSPGGQTGIVADTAASELAIGLVLDCEAPETLAPFWAAALHYTYVGALDNYALLTPDGRSGPNLLLQKVPEAKRGKNRMHLDIETPDIDAEVARLEQLGATRIEAAARNEHGMRWIVMADPEGNEFCVCTGVAP